MFLTVFIFLLLVINLIFVFKLKKISQLLNIYDIPDGKLKLHSKKTPLIGGLILVVNFSLVFVYQITFSKNFLFLDIGSTNNLEIFSILFLIYSFFFLGLCDDKYHLSPFKKLFLLIVLILITIFLNKRLILSDFALSFYYSRIFFENFSIIFTIFCILTLTNALNFYDGINGQSCIIFLVFFSYLFLKSDLNFFYLISFIFIFMVMMLNLKNLLFLGDSGIYLISSILSISLIYEYNIHKSIHYADEIFFLLLLPGLDLIRLTIIRIFHNKNIFYGDRNHIHHLINKKFSLTNTNIILFVLSVFPIILFLYFSLNFFIVFIVFLVLYISIVVFFKKI